MKTIKFSLINLLMVLSISLFSQKSVHVVKVNDSMDKSSMLMSSRKCVIANADKSQGFILDVLFANSGPTIFSTMVGIGNCNENDKLLILFDNDERLELTSWKGFNCDGEGYFRLTDAIINKLLSSPINKVRMTNGRTFDSYTGIVEQYNKTYFIELFTSYKSGNYTIINH